MHSIQRKIQSFITELLKKESVDEVVTALRSAPEHHIPEATFLLNKDASIKYEDSDEFIKDATAAFRYFGKMRGFRKEAAEALSEFESLLQVYFPSEQEGANGGDDSVGNSGRKRRFESTSTVMEESNGLSSSEKASLNELVAAICADDGAVDFKFPVDSRCTIISHPQLHCITN